MASNNSDHLDDNINIMRLYNEPPAVFTVNRARLLFAGRFNPPVLQQYKDSVSFWGRVEQFLDLMFDCITDDQLHFNITNA